VQWADNDMPAHAPAPRSGIGLSPKKGVLKYDAADQYAAPPRPELSESAANQLKVEEAIQLEEDRARATRRFVVDADGGMYDVSDDDDIVWDQPTEAPRTRDICLEVEEGEKSNSEEEWDEGALGEGVARGLLPGITSALANSISSTLWAVGLGDLPAATSEYIWGVPREAADKTPAMDAAAAGGEAGAMSYTLNPLVERLKVEFPRLPDVYILRAIYSKKKYSKIASMLQRFSAFYEEYTFDQVSLIDIDPLIDLNFMYFPPRPHHLTRKGIATLYVNLGRWDVYSGVLAPHYAFKSVMAIIDRLMMEPEAVEKGVVFIVDCTEAGVTTFDPELITSFIWATANTYPMRVKGVWLLNAGVVAQSLVYLVLPLLGAKLRSRIHFIESEGELRELIDPEDLPEEFGGELEYDGDEFFAEAEEIFDGFLPEM